MRHGGIIVLEVSINSILCSICLFFNFFPAAPAHPALRKTKRRRRRKNAATSTAFIIFYRASNRSIYGLARRGSGYIFFLSMRSTLHERYASLTNLLICRISLIQEVRSFAVVS
jgi:hypothetical protein